MNTSETPPDGAWFRNRPHTADTDRLTGHGVYVNERVQLQRYARGDAVGAYHNTLWYFVLNVTRPTNVGVTKPVLPQRPLSHGAVSRPPQRLLVSSANQRSTKFSQEALVGMSKRITNSGHQVCSVLSSNGQALCSFVSTDSL